MINALSLLFLVNQTEVWELPFLYFWVKIGIFIYGSIGLGCQDVLSL